MNQCRENVAGEEELKGQRAERRELSHQTPRAAHMDEPCLYPALVPARALPEPCPETRRRRRRAVRRDRGDRRRDHSATDPDLPLSFPGPIGSAVAYLADPPPHRFLRRAHRRT